MKTSTTLCAVARCSHFYRPRTRGVCAVCSKSVPLYTVLPFQSSCHVERVYPHARYTRERDGEPLILTPTMPENGDNATATVRWSSIQRPDREGELPLQAHPITVIVQAGQTLYLPVGWWHHVRQVGGTTIAINWWYDVEGQGMNWVWLNFLRGPRKPVPSGNDV